MKKLYTIILLFVSSYLYGIEFPQAQFQSTSNCQTVTRYNPHITNVGATSVYEDNNQTYNGKSGIRKVKDDPYNPMPTPIGDTPVILFLVLIGFYIIYKKIKIEAK